MTDEELAKEWAKEHEGEYISDLMNLEEAFLAGLKAGRPKFHKIAVEGLPSDSSGQTYLVVDAYDCYMLASFDNGTWYNYYNIENVVAWFEIPMFKE